mmetsp:Transcript_75421/g.125746  ORF Transcript_75421/g.125746 Transcript_75421/m.125746 type:complete len:84 (+) Transcript_75421:1419-1670(+)
MQMMEPKMRDRLEDYEAEISLTISQQEKVIGSDWLWDDRWTSNLSGKAVPQLNAACMLSSCELLVHVHVRDRCTKSAITVPRR